MKKKLLFSILLIGTLLNFRPLLKAQIAQWRLNQTSYSAIDPDGAGPAKGVVQFQLQLHALSGSFVAKEISTGFSWQSARAMLPNTATCTGGPPSNIVVSAAFTTAGYSYTAVNQCNAPTPFTAGGQVFDRIAAGTLDPSSGSITITTAWTSVFTVTLWTLGTAVAEGGYAAIHSSGSGTPGPLGTYAIADNAGNEVNVNSLSFANPLPLASTTAPLPVLFTKFSAQCQADRSISVTWSTLQEVNNNYFEIEKTFDGITWTTVQKVAAGVNSSTEKNYQVNDPQGGAAQYRLKQVDRDGKANYSPIVKTSCEGRNVYVTLYPVPARDVVNLIIGSDKKVKTNLQVYDSKGKLVIDIAASITQGINNFKIPVQALAAGEYFIKGTNGELEISKRFSIAR